MFPDPISPRNVKKRFKAAVLALVLAGLVAGWQVISRPQTWPQLSQAVTNSQPGLYRVAKVDDGDTIVVQSAGGTETVRLIGIDTPEVKDPRKPVQCYAAEASDQTKRLLSGQAVRLEPDPIGDNRDKYHRLLRYVYLPNGTFINDQLVRQGYAFAYVVFPFTKLDQFKAAELAAHEQRLGLWSHCQVDSSTDIKQTNPVAK